MVAIKELGRRSVKERWADVWSWWEEGADARELERRVIKRTLESSMVAELEHVLQARPYGRTPRRHGYRNGYRVRTLFTGAGVIPDLHVPRATGVEYTAGVLTAYQRRAQEINAAIRQMYFEGLATRRIGPILEQLFGRAVSASTVSRITREVEAEVHAFHRRLLPSNCRFLFLDGVVVSSRHGASHTKQVLLCAVAITQEGRKVFLDYRRAKSESEAEWRVLLNSLLLRGILPDTLELIATDGGSGLHAALLEVYPDVPRQRCWAHKLRNVSDKLHQAVQEQCLTEAKRIYLASSRRQALQRFWEWKRRWEGLEPKAIACLEADLEELLTVFRIEQRELHSLVRTTNQIERFFREVRRRTRPMGCFQNMDSAERVMYAIASKLNRKWEDRPLPQFKSPHSS
ncbi:MAG: IS256 family transposase [Acidobacteria bacterium]|nr:IS256 family transposase [Acidobacteriota bacterium]